MSEQQLTLKVTEDEWWIIRFGIKRVVKDIAGAALEDVVYPSACEIPTGSPETMITEATKLWRRLEKDIRKQAADCLTREAQETGLGYQKEEQTHSSDCPNSPDGHDFVHWRDCKNCDGLWHE